MERGYVKLWRKTFDSGLMGNPNALCLFCYLLMNATHKEKKFSSNGVIVELHPGDAIFSRKVVSEKLKISEQSTRTALEFLKKLEIVTSRPTNKFTIISLINWHKYQQQETNNQPADQPTGNQQVTNNQPTGNQQVTTALRMKECKNVRMEENKDSGGQAPAPTPSRARFIPPTVEDVQDYASSVGKRIDAQRFVDFYASKNWMVGKNKMSNWKTAVSGWIHREEERRQNTLVPFNNPSLSRDPNRCVALPKPKGWK